MHLIGGSVGWRSTYDCRAEGHAIRARLASLGSVQPLHAVHADASLTGRPVIVRDGPIILSLDRVDGDPVDWRKLGGTDIPRRIANAFALALYDPHRRRLILARSADGARPLFAHERPGGLAFSSVPSGLFGLTGGKIDLARLARGLSADGASPERTHWSGIRNVRPGTMEIHDSQGSSVIDLVNPDQRGATEGAAARLAELIDDAVARARPHGAVAIALSSGLDSNAVLASIVRTGERNAITAHTAAPAYPSRIPMMPHRFGDESALASIAAQAVGVRHEIHRDPRRIVETIHDQSRYFEGPVPNPINEGWLQSLYRAASEQGAERLLVAAHGNTTVSFGGLSVLPEWLHRGRPSAFFHQWRHAIGMADTNWRGVAYNGLAPWIPSLLSRRLGGGVHEGAVAFVRPEWRHARARADSPTAMTEQRRWRLIQADQGLNNLANQRRFGIATRDPTGDAALVDFTLGLPPEAFLDRGVSRPIFKQAMHDRIAEPILHLSLRAFQGADFFARIDRHEAQRALDRVEGHERVRSLFLIDSMRLAIARWPSFDPRAGPALFAFVRAITDALATAAFLAEVDDWIDRRGVSAERVEHVVRDHAGR